MRLGHILAAVSVSLLMTAVNCGPKPIDISCKDSVKSLGDQVAGQDSFKVNCPAACSPGSIWGTDLYTGDSAICTAARHAGVIETDGGEVTVEVLPGAQSYTGTERNGIKTGDWGSYGSSYKVK